MTMIERKVLAACLARTNTGLHEPDALDIVYAVKLRSSSINSAVEAICGDFMSDAAPGYFEEEAQGFLEMMAPKTDDDIKGLWSHRAAMIAHCDTEINID